MKFSATSPSTDELPDDDVVARVVAGERALFELLMRRHNRRLYRTIRSIVRSDAETEEVMQQAYVQAFTGLAQFERRASFATWLTRIGVHAALAHLRRAKREQPRASERDGADATRRVSFGTSAFGARAFSRTIPTEPIALRRLGIAAEHEPLAPSEHPGEHAWLRAATREAPMHDPAVILDRRGREDWTGRSEDWER